MESNRHIQQQQNCVRLPASLREAQVDVRPGAKAISGQFGCSSNHQRLKGYTECRCKTNEFQVKKKRIKRFALNRLSPYIMRRQ